ncbi:MAG: Rrf2 family transcriptional regulator [Deltaproteobacteria bacterium]|nr:Rrf2 family transcriptional regulator [Deltaproteobacteria bacterium]MBW2399269.1 Rrf2 family transcriptional regulator [Deltaproteobacteria bacterium]MBW2667304.1 Rrf2 family transcriptional regulator [Deltaproteobacteria bacterium]
MLISQTSEYALRAMAWLASAPPGEPVRSRDLAAGSGIPLHYLSKILRRLVLAELLVSQKGKRGGFVLARPVHEIRFLDILAAVDAYPTHGRCGFGWGECDELNPCSMHDTWSELNGKILSWAANNTLADVQSKVPDPWPGRPSRSQDSENPEESEEPG